MTVVKLTRVRRGERGVPSPHAGQPCRDFLHNHTDDHRILGGEHIGGIGRSGKCGEGPDRLGLTLVRSGSRTHDGVLEPQQRVLWDRRGGRPAE